MTSSVEQASSLYKEGRLAAAIDAATRAVKDSPSDLAARWLLAELLIVGGDLERADKQLDTLMSLDARAAVNVIPLRHLVRAETARREFFRSASLPDFLAEGPTKTMALRLESFVQLRAGDTARASELAEAAEDARAMLPGTIGDRPFSDLRDLDDVVAGVFEVLTHTGKYYWIPAERVELLEFTPPATPLDLVWRPVHMVVRDGFDAQVHMPAIYGVIEGTIDGGDDAAKLGRSTTWIGDPPAPVRGVGQRLFVLDGDHEIGVMELSTVTFKVG